jgi:hypothetical protein
LLFLSLPPRNSMRISFRSLEGAVKNGTLFAVQEHRLVFRTEVAAFAASS